MSKITTIIVAKGNPKYIFETINSVEKISAEIIVVDIGLDKNISEKLQKTSKLKIIDEKSVLYVEEIREKTKTYSKTEYILFIDPDEILPSKLQEELLAQYDKYDYLSMPRKNIIFGKWISNARWFPDYQTRLFKKDAVVWSNKLHSQPEKTGQELLLPENEELAIIHYNYESLDEFMLKMIRYAKADASNRSDYSIAKALADGTQEFISRYFAFDGYKSGMHGFALSFLQLLYYPLVYFYFWEGKKYQNEEDKKITNAYIDFVKKLLHDSLYWGGSMNEVGKIRIKEKILKFLIKK